MSYYLKVYMLLFKHTLEKEMQMPLKFLGTVIGGFMHFIINLLFFQSIYLSTSSQSINGWGAAEMQLLIATYNLSFWLYAFFAGGSIGSVSSKIISGELDSYLLKPVNPQFLLSLANVNLSAFFNLLWPICLIIYQMQHLNTELSFFGIAIYVVLVINGAILNYCMMFIAQILAFWVGRNTGLHLMISSMLQLAQYPGVMFNNFFRAVFTYIFPIVVIANYPVMMLIRSNHTGLLGISAMVTGIFIALMLILWRISIRRYTSAS